MPIPAGTAVVSVETLASRPAVQPLTDAYVEVDGWVAPGIDALGTEWICTAVDGWNGTPSVRTSGEDRPEAHGQFDSPNFYGARTITIEGTAMAPSREIGMAAQDALVSVAAWDTRALFTLRVTEPGVPAKQAQVRLDAPTKISTVYDGQAFDWQMTLRAPDPLRYAASEATVSLVLPAPSGSDGLSVPFTVPLYVPALSASTTQLDVVNFGTFETRNITATFTGPVDNPTLTNATTGLTLAFGVSLAAGQTLVADFTARVALLNGVTPYGHTLAPSARWWALPPGASTLILGGLGGPGSGVEVRYRSAWL